MLPSVHFSEIRRPVALPNPRRNHFRQAHVLKTMVVVIKEVRGGHCVIPSTGNWNSLKAGMAADGASERGSASRLVLKSSLGPRDPSCGRQERCLLTWPLWCWGWWSPLGPLEGRSSWFDSQSLRGLQNLVPRKGGVASRRFCVWWMR